MPRTIFALILASLVCAGRCGGAEAAGGNPAGRAAELSPRQIYQQAGPAVVLLLCVGKDGTGELGTGSVMDDEGHIVTNAHVVIRQSSGEPYEKIHVYFKPSRVTGDPKQDLVNPRTARVLKADRALDLALLELEEKPSPLAVLPLGDASAVEAGEPVVAIGHPEQGGLWTLTQGVVSTMIAGLGGVPGKDVFQTDASINRGNSGGPLISREGAMIGVNTSMARKASDGLTITSVNFSLKSSVVKNWLASTGIPVAYSELAPASGGDSQAKAPPAEPPAAKVETPKPQAAEQAKAEEEPPKTPSEPAQAAPARETTQPKSPSPAESPKTPAKIGSTSEKAAPRPAIVTPAKPYKIGDLIAREIAEMEDLEKEMRREVEKRRDLLQSSSGKRPTRRETAESLKMREMERSLEQHEDSDMKDLEREVEEKGGMSDQ